MKELLPVVLAAAVWEQQWAGQHVLFISDNMAVVSALSAQSARNPMLFYLLRCLIFWEARFNFSHSAEHLAGKLNTAADALSHNNLSLFHSLTPQAKAAPSSIPHQLLLLLTDHELHWTSPTWANLFRDSLSRV